MTPTPDSTARSQRATRRALSAFLGLLLGIAGASSQQLYSLQTPRQNLLYYSKLSEYLVPHTARCFENAYAFHRHLFGYESDGPITVMLQDFDDYGNGAAGVSPRNLVSIGMAPVSNVYETLPANERMNWVMNHELVHVVTLDKPSGTDRFWRSVFSGKPSPTSDNALSMLYGYLTMPRTYSTRWYREGIAAFVETWMAGGLGRALGSYDEMLFRTMVRDSAYFYDWVGLEAEGTKVDFQVGANAYLYGTRFMTYLTYQYGPDKLIAWTARTEDSDAHFASEFRRVYGSSLDEEWQRWIDFEHTWQRMNLDSVRLHPITPVRHLTTQAVGSVSRAFYLPERRSILAGINYPGQVPHIAIIDIADGRIEQVCEVKGASLYDVASLAYDPASETAFFSIDNNSWRDLSSVNLRTGDVTVLQRDTRIGELVFNRSDRTLWGVRHDNGYCTIVRMNPPYIDWNTVHIWPYGTYVTDLDLSPDGSLLTAAQVSISGRQRLIALPTGPLLDKTAAVDTLFDFDLSVPANFVFTPDGSALVGTSYYTGISNVFRYTFVDSSMDVLSNVETGLFRPMVQSADSLIVFRYSGKGFIPAIMGMHKTEDVSAIRFLGNETIERHPVLAQWTVGSPANIPLDSMTSYRGSFSPASAIRVGSMYPVVEGYKDVTAFGFRMNLSDPLMLHSIDATATWAPHQFIPSDERLHATLRYRVLNWHFGATLNAADFYDLFGPTKLSRKGYSVTARYRLPLLLNDPETMEATFSAGAYGGLERTPDFQNVLASFDRLYTARAALEYHWYRKSLGAADYEKGIGWSLLSKNNYVRNRLFPLVYGTFDIGTPLPIDHSALWLRTTAGVSFGDRNDPFGNFFFGGFGNNWVDHQEPKRYREQYAFPGTTLNAVGGATYGRAMLEWLLPPLRFRNAGAWFLYASWAHPTIFASFLTTDPDRAAVQRTLANLGAQVDVKLALMSSLDATFSIGYALAFERGSRPTREFMVSLKIL
ncbi:MAG: hypothetical protein AABY75_06220 [Bacteroidota bacterium]